MLLVYLYVYLYLGYVCFMLSFALDAIWFNVIFDPNCYLNLFLIRVPGCSERAYGIVRSEHKKASVEPIKMF
jgi:hypothetical protein